ncbi:MAG TPA: hypothetical protein VNQ56_15470 [Pseudolabrys sp.]|nr:hypothetical protein [Pseudolabrys sp.]
MNPIPSFLDNLKGAADSAAAAEDEFRHSIAQRTKSLEQERKFAFRRLNLMRAVAEVVTGAENEAMAVVAANAVLRSKLGWETDSAARAEVFSQFAPVVQAMFTTFSSPEKSSPDADVLRALDEFESWYLQNRPGPFWVLFENYIPETPVVDF